MHSKTFKFLISLIDIVREHFPELFHQAIIALKRKAVKKYVFSSPISPIYIVVGQTKDYLVEIKLGKKVKYSCTCPDFQYNIVTTPYRGLRKKSRPLCYHILAVIISIISEVAYHTDLNLKMFKKRELLPDILMEYMDYINLIKSAL